MHLLQASCNLFNRMVSNTTAASSNVTGPTEQLELFGNKVVYIALTIYGHPSVSFEVISSLLLNIIISNYVFDQICRHSLFIGKVIWIL